jgi:hypothetical protein
LPIAMCFWEEGQPGSFLWLVGLDLEKYVQYRIFIYLVFCHDEES